MARHKEQIMSQPIPQHRAAISPRSGDTHVIGDKDHAEAINIDQAARDAAAAAAELAARPVPRRKADDSSGAAD